MEWRCAHTPVHEAFCLPRAPSLSAAAASVLGPGELWTGVSTAAFASSALEAAGGKASSQAVADALTKEFRSLLASYYGGDVAAVPQPVHVSAKR